MEQEEYTKEEIDWSYIEFVDNQDVLDLIEKVNSSFNSRVETTGVLLCCSNDEILLKQLFWLHLSV